MPEFIANVDIVDVNQDDLDNVAAVGDAFYSDVNLRIQAATTKMLGPADQIKGSYQRC
jgi:hypothetical protein